ncbi:glycoside hydrolase family 15 protein [Dyella sp.]|uniref:glycoside hydrolase family 15 protein n=1 Tax=Dyella sp. TaxID=1869338 RepID=UPI002D7A0C9C|nr:glycoside hydrolase family 15 protein [Dyella sp.]HET6433126.1 glycoside hydrolase family 15 protein [Dyella sp.]
MSRIEHYALLGDGRSAALVGRDGSIDWLCWPRIGSDTCFAALLGEHRHGRWLLAPAEKAAVARVERHYRRGTATLETRWHTADGVVEVSEAMPWRSERTSVVRSVRCVSGCVPMRLELRARFDYGKALPGIRRHDGRWQLVMGPIALWLDTDVKHLSLDAEGDAVCGEWLLREGDNSCFALQCTASVERAPAPMDATQALADSDAFWTDWADAVQPGDGPHADAVLRSLVTLKALTERDGGGVAAAATSSLPECIGGKRNWDYRYGWLRDASFTLLAFAGAGLRQEAAQWRNWLMRCIAGHPAQLQIMYGLDGRRRIDEWVCDWLPGYEQSAPVRFGNGAAKQVQVDVYGEVLNALYHARRHGLAPDPDTWSLECALVEHLANVWREPGHGIWEMRGAPRVFTHSRVMAWVAVDRALRSAREFGHSAPLARWEALAGSIREDVLAHGIDPLRGCFTQCYGQPALDASLLLLPIYGFLPADDPRIAATVRAIESELDEGNGLLMRYRHTDGNDGLEGGEGTFIACSFWLAHVKHLQGRHDEARQLLSRLLALCNDVGLLSEEYDVGAARLCGNFPQALSHVALINTVRALGEG